MIIILFSRQKTDTYKLANMIILMVLAMKHDSFERKKKILDLLLSKDRLEFLFSESTKKKIKMTFFSFPPSA